MGTEATRATTPLPWERNWRRELSRRLVDLLPQRLVPVALNGCAVAFFTSGTLAGALCLGGIALLSTRAALFAAVAVLTAAVASSVLESNRELHRSGVPVFNGFLYGAFLSMVELAPGWTLPALLGGALLSVPVYMLVQDLLTRGRLDCPALSVPAVLLIWALILLARAGSEIPEHFWSAPAGWNLVDRWSPRIAENLRAWSPGEMVEWGTQLGGGSLGALGLAAILLAVALNSCLAALLLLLGLGFALLVAVGFGGAYGYVWHEFVFYAGAPVLLALGGYFVVFTWRSLLMAVVACVVAFQVWLVFCDFEAGTGLPPFTAPLAVTTLLFLIPLKLLLLRGSLRAVVAVPLMSVGVPEEARRWYREQLLGARYWKDVIAWTRSGGEQQREAQLHHGVELLLRSKRITVLSGAGISTESGIPDYRSGTIDWRQYDVSQFRYENFLRDEEARRAYWRMSQDFYTLIRTAEPNPGHRALVQLEEMGMLHKLITQNVDRLHERGGNSPGRIIELHGNEFDVVCLECDYRVSRDEVYWWIVGGLEVPYCPVCQGILKPDSVAFGQPMPIEESHQALRASTECDLFIVVGSSLTVQPAATLPLSARRAGARLLFVNLGFTSLDRFADVHIHGAAGDVLPELLRRMQVSSHYFRAEQQSPGWGDVR